MERLCRVFQLSPVNEQVTWPLEFLLTIIYKDTDFAPLFTILRAPATLQQYRG